VHSIAHMCVIPQRHTYVYSVVRAYTNIGIIYNATVYTQYTCAHMYYRVYACVCMICSTTHMCVLYSTTVYTFVCTLWYESIHTCVYSTVQQYTHLCVCVCVCVCACTSSTTSIHTCVHSTVQHTRLYSVVRHTHACVRK